MTRRSFLARAGMLGALAANGDRVAVAAARELEAGDRLGRAFALRMEAARQVRRRGGAELVPNGDEDALPHGIACYSKALPHDALGHVEPKAYAFLRRALGTGKPAHFEAIPLGGQVKLANPQAALGFELVGPDGSQLAIPPAPGFASAEQAGEMVELYWQALARDVPFTAYDSDPLIRQAAEDLSRLSDFAGPKRGGRVEPSTLFRGTAAGDLAGPYVSQFLWKELPYSPIRVEQRIRTAAAGLDYLTDYGAWLALQNGALSGVNRFDEQRLFIRNGRDLGEYVHRDFTYQAFLGACLAALRWGALPDGGNPYKHSRTQSGFATFGQPYLLYVLAVVTQVALQACWFQKWLVHRRLRPEELGGRVENHLRGKAEYPLHRELFDSAALAETRRRFGTALLPQAYPEGCPTHPAYPAGHAVIAGACATVLKACLDESHVVPEPVEASPDGTKLLPYEGPPLTLGGELDKLASNISLGRNFAGIHWRSDAAAGMLLGEEVGIAVLEELRLTGNEVFAGWSLRRLDGSRAALGRER